MQATNESMDSLLPKQTAALSWIFTLLSGREIPCVFCGGLAAIGYGSRRPLHDIDLFVPGDRFIEVVQAGEKYISKPAQHYREHSEGWDLEYVQFMYRDIKVEVGNSNNASIYDSKEEKWVSLDIAFERSHYQQLLGIEIPLMQRDDLIAYKTRLGRPVDSEDIADMLRSI